MIKLKDILNNSILENVESSEFKQWFAGSKIVDKDGKPMRVYHGTNKSFEIFKLSSEGIFGKGIYLTSDPKRASVYSRESAFGNRRETGNNVIPLYASIKNPLIVNYESDPSISALVALDVDRKKAVDIVNKAFEEKGNLTGQIFKKAQLKGYDGIVCYMRDESLEIVAFNPKQVKSAITNKTYSSSPNITKETSL